MGILVLLEDGDREQERVEVLDGVTGGRDAVAVDNVRDRDLGRAAVEDDRALEVGEHDPRDRGTLAVEVASEAGPDLRRQDPAVQPCLT